MSASFDRQALIAYRLQQARQTWQDAQLLLENGGSPNSVVNRAYYAIFYAALALMVTGGWQVSKHSGVIARFDQEFVKNGKLPKALSHIMHRAFDLRQIGDYREMLTLSREQAAEILDDALTFIQAVERYLSSHTGQ